MPHRIVQPSKEQVRAYMQARGRARRPPPSPAEIRQQLGWRIDTAPKEISLAGIYRIPTEYSRVVLRLLVEWWIVQPVTFYALHPGLKSRFKYVCDVKQ